MEIGVFCGRLGCFLRSFGVIFADLWGFLGDLGLCFTDLGSYCLVLR